MQEVLHHGQRVALGCLSCYNEGRLIYKWLNADELEEAHESGNLAKAVCSRADTIYHKRDEWHVQDYDGEIGRLRLGENPDIENLIQMMRLIDNDPDKYAVACIAAYDAYESPTADEVEEIADMMLYVGDQLLEDYFMEMAYDCGYIKNGDYWESYIDWEHYARNCMFDYTEYKYRGDTYLLPHH
tara:strand:- start:25 stop:579 length:555 start_codon:yes stop_codon:yes gene_type:complete